ncbi:MAG: hypothetical protein V1709_10905 [Planctomycetota bacterium]
MTFKLFSKAVLLFLVNQKVILKRFTIFDLLFVVFYAMVENMDVVAHLLKTSKRQLYSREKAIKEVMHIIDRSERKDKKK